MSRTPPTVRILATSKPEIYAEKIAEKILNVFSDLEKAEKIGVEGRTVALKCFDWRVYSLPLNEWLADV